MNFLIILLLLLISSIGTIGLGLLMAGLTLYHKKIGGIMGFYMSAYFAVSIFLKNTMFVNLLPFYKTFGIINEIIKYNEINIGGDDILLIFLSTIPYFLLGLLIFKISEKCALKKGNLKEI
ncbi:hypothetical protein KAU33_10410 [Candidatus Dependentiae bacterium]|nr:hypothetical protein [Candidatus Dependentiae bacterium]